MPCTSGRQLRSDRVDSTCAQAQELRGCVLDRRIASIRSRIHLGVGEGGQQQPQAGDDEQGLVAAARQL